MTSPAHTAPSYQSEGTSTFRLIATLKRWAEPGMSNKPGAWLMPCVNRCAIHLLRTCKQLDCIYEEMEQ